MAEPNIVILDCETTGTDRARDQIIEVCIQRGLRGGFSERWRIKPSVPIHPDAQAVHGITSEQLAACRPFVDHADAIVAEIAGADVIVGYNVAFDLEMLHGELARAGKPPLDMSRKFVVDAYRLWQQCEPRKLQDAHRRFVGATFEQAHSAEADVAATGRVLERMLAAFELGADDWSAIARRADPDHGVWIGPSRHLRWEHGVVVVAFGKHKGVALHELAAGPDRSFLQWVMTKDFPVHVKEVCRGALVRPREEFLAWVAERYPRPAKETTDAA